METSPEPKDLERSSVEIIPALPADAEGILKVGAETWEATYPNEELGITLEDIADRNVISPERIQLWESSIKDPRKHVMVAKEDGVVIGYCLSIKGEKNELRALYVSPRFQGKGIGKKLMVEALVWFGEDQDIYLGVASYNAKTIDFYRSLGFEFVDENYQTGSVKLGTGKEIPTREMVKRANN